MRDLLYISHPTYTQTVKLLVSAAEIAGAEIREYPFADLPGSTGEALSTFVITLGPQDAPLVFVVDIGIHGPEIFGGASTLVWLLENMKYLGISSGIKFIFIAPTNPYGVSWLCRPNGNNVDLNRNFRQFPLPPDEKPCKYGYELLHDVINPKMLGHSGMLFLHLHLAEYIATESAQEIKCIAQEENWRKLFSLEPLKYGWWELKKVVASGQYKYPQGVQFGGFKPEQENLLIRKIIHDTVPKSAQKLAWMNDHVGLGPYAGSTVIVEFGKNTPVFKRCHLWFGNDHGVETTTEAYAISTEKPARGAIDWAVEEEVRKIAPRCEITVFCHEVGSHPSGSLFAFGIAEIQNNWLHQQDRDFDSAHARAIKDKIFSLYFPKDDKWRIACRDKKIQICLQAIGGIAQTGT